MTGSKTVELLTLLQSAIFRISAMCRPFSFAAEVEAPHTECALQAFVSTPSDCVHGDLPGSLGRLDLS